MCARELCKLFDRRKEAAFDGRETRLDRRRRNDDR